MMSTPHKPRAAGHRWLAAVASAACMATGIALAADSVTFTAGSPGGGYFKAAAAFGEYIKSDIPGTSVTVIPGGGWANVERLDQASKAADVAVLENALASMAYEGTGPTGKKYDFRMLAAFRQPGAAQALVLDSAEIGSFEELNEKKPPIRITMFERHQLATGQALAVPRGVRHHGKRRELVGRQDHLHVHWRSNANARGRPGGHVVHGGILLPASAVH